MCIDYNSMRLEVFFQGSNVFYFEDLKDVSTIASEPMNSGVWAYLFL